MPILQLLPVILLPLALLGGLALLASAETRGVRAVRGQGFELVTTALGGRVTLRRRPIERLDDAKVLHLEAREGVTSLDFGAPARWWVRVRSGSRTSILSSLPVTDEAEAREQLRRLLAFAADFDAREAVLAAGAARWPVRTGTVVSWTVLAALGLWMLVWFR